MFPPPLLALHMCADKVPSFHCLFCHGYEERGAPSAGVLAIGELSAVPPALHLGRAARQLAGAVTIYTDGSESLSTALAKEIGSHEKDRIRTDSRQISKLVKEDEGTDITIHFRDGTTMRETFLVHRPKTDLNGPFAQQLGLELLPTGDIKTTPPFHETSSQGVFAIGDCASPGKIVANAIATGAFAGAGVAAQLQVSVL
jgi:thioredoxin reductase